MPERWQTRREGPRAAHASGSLPHLRSLHDLVEFFKAHDMGDSWAHRPEAHCAVDIQSRSCLISMDEDCIRQVSDSAQSQRVSVAVLREAWLRESVAGARHSTRASYHLAADCRQPTLRSGFRPRLQARGARRTFSTSFSARYTSTIAGDPPRHTGGAMAVRSTRH